MTKEQAIEQLKDLKAVYSGAVQAGEISIANMIKGGIDLIEKLQKENEELKEYNMEYKRILDLADNRIYRKKYLEERRKEQPNLLYPDSDEIYQRYYELKQENEELKEKENKIYKEVQESLSFEKFLIAKDREPDLFNQGRFYISQIVYDILNDVQNPEGIHKENKYIKYKKFYKNC